MKYIKIILFVSLFLMTSCGSMRNVPAKVYGINYSIFMDEVYPKIDKPVVVLFGSRYCAYSGKQLSLLKREIQRKGYDEYIDFFAVDCETEENYDWLIELCEAKNIPSKLQGTPTWVYYEKLKDGEIHILVNPGNMTAEFLKDDFSRLINNYNNL